MDGVGELLRVGQVGGLGLHPQDVGERGRCQGLRDRVRNAAAHLVVPLGRLGPLAVPRDIGPEFLGLLPGDVERRTFGERAPLAGAHRRRFAFTLAELEEVGHRAGVGVEAGVVLPGVDEAGLDGVERRIQRLLGAVLPCRRGLVDEVQYALATQPRFGGGVLAIGQRVEQVAVQLGHAFVVEAAHHRQEAGLVRRDLEVGHAEQERLITFVGPAVDQIGRLGVGARDDDARHPHDVELEARGVEPLDLLVRGHQHLAALVAALLGARPLVLDVVTRHPVFDETPNQVAHVGISAVSGVRVGDDEWSVVVFRRGCALLGGHLQSQVLLVAVGGQQRADDAGRFLGHLAERIAGQVGSRILADGPLRRGGPAAEVDPFDAHPFHHHGLAGGVGAERRDAPALGEQLTQVGVERGGGLARDRVVGGNGAALLGDLTRGVEPDDALEPGAVEIALGVDDIALERCLRREVSFGDGHDPP